MYDDEDSLFGSPPPSPQFQTEELASICDDDDRRLSTSIDIDTQNVGTIALPGSHYSELPLNPLALSLNHATVHRPPAYFQDQSTTPEVSLPDPSEPPPAHFHINNQQINASTITHTRGTSLNPIVVDDEDTPIQKNFVNPPPVKRRKLYCVPAGAADWDVPYPFQEGDGPDGYHKTWEHKRSKELVLQFVKLIKLAERNGFIKPEHSTPSLAPIPALPQAAVAVPPPPPASTSASPPPSTSAPPPPASTPALALTPPPPASVPVRASPSPPVVPVLAPPPPAPRPKNTSSTISQSRKEEILRRAREKRRQVKEELDRVKTQLWETTIEQAALVHLSKRYELLENDQDLDGGGGGGDGCIDPELLK